jgi:hypothetical protein
VPSAVKSFPLKVDPLDRFDRAILVRSHVKRTYGSPYREILSIQVIRQFLTDSWINSVRDSDVGYEGNIEEKVPRQRIGVQSVMKLDDVTVAFGRHKEHVSVLREGILDCGRASQYKEDLLGAASLLPDMLTEDFPIHADDGEYKGEVRIDHPEVEFIPLGADRLNPTEVRLRDGRIAQNH